MSQARCRQMGVAGLKGIENLAGGFQHGPFHFPSTLLGIGTDQRVLGADGVFMPIQVISRGAVAGGDFENAGFRWRFEFCCLLSCRLLAIIFTAAGEQQRQNQNTGCELPSGHSEVFPVFWDYAYV